MTQILQPLKIRHRDTARVRKQVRDHDYSFALQYLVAFERRRSVGTLQDYLGLDVLRIMHVYSAICCAGSEDIAFLPEKESGILCLNLVAQRTVLERSVLGEVLLHFIRVETLLGVDAGVPLDDSDNFGALCMQDPREVITDVAEALHDDSLALDSGAQVGDFAESVVVKQLSEDEEAAHSGRLGSAVDAALAQELARCAS